MGLRKKLALNWKGKEYPLLVTMEVIDRVEDELNIGQLLLRHASGDVRYSHVAKMLSLLLNEAGAKTNQEEVYVGMFDGEGIAVAEVNALVDKVFSTFFPEQKKKEKQK